MTKNRNQIGKHEDTNHEYLSSFKRPKNLVLFIGDGLGLATVTAARIYKGQNRFGLSGEETNLVWEAFPEVAMLKVKFPTILNGVGGAYSKGLTPWIQKFMILVAFWGLGVSILFWGDSPRIFKNSAPGKIIVEAP